MFLSAADFPRLASVGGRALQPSDAEYPAGLLDLEDRPAWLGVRGVIPPHGIAVVGSRDASAEACAFAGELVAALALPLVSGLARGIDAAAHGAAFARCLPQVAYVGTGLARTYPPEHVGLAERIVAAGGAIASEYAPDDEVTPQTLVQRDRLQAAHAIAVVLIETDLTGGAMHTMAFARRLDRGRFALDSLASGNRRALAEGAVRLPWNVTTAADELRRYVAREGGNQFSISG